MNARKMIVMVMRTLVVRSGKITIKDSDVAMPRVSKIAFAASARLFLLQSSQQLQQAVIVKMFLTDFLVCDWLSL